MMTKISPEKILEKALKPKICRVCNNITCYEDLTKGKAYKGTDFKTTKTICKKCFNKKREEQRKRNPSTLRKQSSLNRSKKYVTTHKELLKNKRLKSTYNVDLQWFYETLIQQDFKCKICSTEISENSARVDHCHARGHIRGLLCNLCNVGLGAFKDNIESLKNAIKYLN